MAFFDCQSGGTTLDDLAVTLVQSGTTTSYGSAVIGDWYVVSVSNVASVSNLSGMTNITGGQTGAGHSGTGSDVRTYCWIGQASSTTISVNNVSYGMSIYHLYKS